MKNNQNRDLLTEVLQESAPPDFEAALFSATLCAARRRKRNRQLGRALVVTSCLAVGLFMFLSKMAVQRGSKEQAAVVSRQALSIVHSQPLTAEAIVQTRPFLADVISSGEFKGLVASGKAKDLFTRVGDEELLAYFAGRPAVLVYRGPGQAELIALNPADLNGFPLQQGSRPSLQ